MDNASYITNSRFLTNGHLAEAGASPAAFIRMDDVVGINLIGNQFMNTSGEKYDWSHKGIGIESYNAAYFMNELCLVPAEPCIQVKRNDFFNLTYGIRAFGQGRENRAITVLNADFRLNQRGMFISFMNNARIDFNTFTIPEKSPEDGKIKYGLYIEYSSGYDIQENSFQGINNGDDDNIGLYISNSGKEPNEVYKNDFTDLNYGIVAYGQNRSETGEGLCLKCNNFAMCLNDIHVIPEKDPEGRWLQGRDQGIASMQGTGGSDTAPAGNTFTDKDILQETFNYFNHENCNLIDYHHHQTYPDLLIIEPDPRSEDIVFLVEEPETDYENEDHACPSNFGGGSLNLTLERNTINSENEQVVIYSDSIQELKDGGDTYSLNLDVYTSTTEEAYEIRQQLLEGSPYLSDTVMKSAIFKENVLPNVMIRDVLVANPQSAKSSEILEKVDERIDPMPDEMLEEILEGRTIKGNLEILDDRLASHQTRKYASLRKLESHYKQDTLDFQGSQDSLISVWESLTDPSVQYKLAFFYLYKGDSLNCFSTLNSIPELNDLSTEEIVDFDMFSELVSVSWSMSNNIMNLDSLSANQLFTLAESKSVPGALARNMIVAAGLTEYHEPIYLSNELKSSIFKPENNRPVSENFRRLKIFPNPATDYFILSYDLSDLRGNFDVEIINTEGKVLFRQKLSGIKNQIVISATSLPASSYILRLIKETSSIEASKFIILR